MEIKYEVVYRSEVRREDFPRIDLKWMKTVQKAIEEKLMTAPAIYGKPLQQDLKGCRRLRVGDYRVVFQIHKNQVHVLAIVHRSSNYKGVGKRI